MEALLWRRWGLLDTGHEILDDFPFTNWGGKGSQGLSLSVSIDRTSDVESLSPCFRVGKGEGGDSDLSGVSRSADSRDTALKNGPVIPLSPKIGQGSKRDFGSFWAMFSFIRAIGCSWRYSIPD